MGTPIGNLGGIAVVPELGYGIVPDPANWVWQHPVSATLGNRREIITPTLLSYAASACKKYSGIYADGDVVVGMDMAKAVIGDILGLAGVDNADTFVLGDGSAPANDSISALISYGGGGAAPTDNLEYIFPGVKATALRIELVADSNSTLTLVSIGQFGTMAEKGLSIPPDPPVECDVLMPDGIGIVTVGVGETHETTVCLQSATMEVSVPKTGFDRRCLGGEMKEPITNSRPEVTFSLNCELDDGTDNNTVGLLEAFNAGTPLGDITIGTEFLIKDAMMSGDFPALAEGVIDFTISGTASWLEVVTTVPAP